MQGLGRLDKDLPLLVRTPSRIRHGAVALRAFPGELKRMVRLGHVQAQPAQGALPGEAEVLRGLHRGPPRLELLLGQPRLLAGFDEPAFQALRLGRCPAMRVARLAPLLPDHAAAKQLEPGMGFRRLPRRRCLHLQRFKPGYQLGLQVLEADQIGGQLLQPLHGFLATRLDATHLRSLFEQLAPFTRCAYDDVLDVVLVDDRVGIHGESR